MPEFRSHIHIKGDTKYGGTYWVTTNKKTGAQAEYQDYQCKYDDCSFSIPIRTGNTK